MIRALPADYNFATLHHGSIILLFGGVAYAFVTWKPAAIRLIQPVCASSFISSTNTVSLPTGSDANTPVRMQLCCMPDALRPNSRRPANSLAAVSCSWVGLSPDHRPAATETGGRTVLPISCPRLLQRIPDVRTGEQPLSSASGVTAVHRPIGRTQVNSAFAVPRPRVRRRR
jgi:hypothetical protein